MCKFNYKNLDDLKQDLKRLELDEQVGLSDDFSVFWKPLTLENGTKINSRFAVHPMEGFDSNPDGSPSELTFRRYQRYGPGRYGLIWFEATAVLPEARSNPSQLWLHDKSWEAFAKLVEKTKKLCKQQSGFEPCCILQLTHSGRYSRPDGKIPKPIIAHHSPYLDKTHGLPQDYPVVTDDYLDKLQDTFLHAAKLAQKAGFDGVDIKSCHRYLISELLASSTRPGKYGGSLENRTRLLREIFAKVKHECPALIPTTRLNAYDALPFPYGFGMNPDGSLEQNLDEPNYVIDELKKLGMPIINITIANPYYEPHYGRPYDTPIIGAPDSPEHPLHGVARFVSLTAKLQAKHPQLPIIGTGYSWLRQWLPNVAAWAIATKRVSMVGLGRMAFAYPDAPKDIATEQKLNPSKVCISCSRCTQIMRDGEHTGCVIRDAKTYAKPYQLAKKAAQIRLGIKTNE